MIPTNAVWVFLGPNGTPAGIFTSREQAQAWVGIHKLSGTLTVFPLDQGCFDWAVENDALTLKPEKLEAKKNDPWFIGTCLPASLDHWHFMDGEEM